MNFDSLKDALNFARDKEQKANDTYRIFSAIVKNTAAKKLLEELARQELGHKKMIEDALESGILVHIGEKTQIADVSFSDFIVPPPDLGPESDPQDVMTYAMKMEQSAYNLYNELLSNYRGTDLETLFSRLAREELKHKEILEEQYEEHFMQWM